MFLDTLGKLPTQDLSQRDNINPTSDCCCTCSITIEEACVKYSPPSLPDRRWHINCLKCDVCHRNLATTQARWSERKLRIICDSCATHCSVQLDSLDLKSGFENVTLLMQFIFLLRVALARLESMLRDNKALPHTSGGSSNDVKLT